MYTFNTAVVYKRYRQLIAHNWHKRLDICHYLQRFEGKKNVSKWKKKKKFFSLVGLRVSY